MTRKLYEEDAYCRSFSSSVISCTKTESSFYVVLDQTAFFPEGGGQPSDVGYIDGKCVSDVQIIDGTIIHTVHEPVIPGETVDCVVDWERRFSNMQNHSGEHVVSGIIHSMFGLNNIGFHLNDGLVTLDVDGKLSDTDLCKVESVANRVVYENRAIKAYYPTPEELLHMDYRSKIEGLDNIRIVTIEGCDCCACCAPHVSQTGEIGIIKIIGSCPNKGGTRIEMLCGISALNDYDLIHSKNAIISKLLSSSRYLVADSVEKLLNSIANKDQEIKSLKRDLAYSQLDIYDCGKVVCAFSNVADYDSLIYCLNNLQLKFDTCFIFSEASEDSILYTLGSKELDLKSFVSKLNAEFSGRGGGKTNFAQGRVNGTRQQVLDFVKSLFPD